MNTAKSFQPNLARGNGTWQLTETLAPFKEKIYKKGEQVIAQGRAEVDLHFVVKGKVLLCHLDPLAEREVITGLFMNGEFINPEILTGDVGEDRYAVAKSDTLVKSIPRLSFLNLMEKTPFLPKLILQSVVERQRKMQARLQRLELMSTRHRVLLFLVEYVEKAGRDVGYERVVRHFLPHHELAGLCNSSRQSVTTILNELRQLKVVHFNRRYLLVRDMERLRKLAAEAFNQPLLS
ncbi:MAG TPA: Crp/Fnr family transcriptional regulator [Bacteroidetes bacterium]|nr:Crp/Fnr family transcriptional regulator [Bacteroidota bacterium]